MQIIKHKSIDMTAKGIIAAVRSGKIPPDVAINIVDDAIVVEPLDHANLFGEPDDDCETIYYTE